MFDRLQYWSRLAANPAFRARVAFEEPLASGINLGAADMAEIQAQVFKIIGGSFEDVGAHIDPASIAGRAALIDRLNGTTRFAVNVRGQLDAFVKLELALLDCFGSLGLLDGIMGLQFPVDIRVVHAQPPDGYLDRRDAVDYLHCDPWRGEPPDLVNVVLYCVASDNASQLELYSIDRNELPIFEAYAGDERDSDMLLRGRPPVRFEHQPGQLILFDGYLPHRTQRRGTEIRISLNFSLRRADPYAVIDERWDRPRQAWDKFWSLNDGTCSDFAARMNAELVRAGAISPAASQGRQRSLATHFGIGSGPQ
jgi:hypothetical protein